MKFWPYERLTIHTTLSSEEVLNKLANVIQPEHTSYLRLFNTNTKPYQGSIVGSYFEISRVVGYRNSFLPVIAGNVIAESSGCSIFITIQPQIFIMLLMIIWLGITGFFFFGFLYAYIWRFMEGRAIDRSFVSIPGALFIFGYAIFLGGFKFESVQSKEFLQELFAATEVDEMGITKGFERAG